MKKYSQFAPENKPLWATERAETTRIEWTWRKMRREIEHLVDMGCSLHWLKKRTKKPFEDDWTNIPSKTLEDLEASYEPGYNVGLRLGKWSVINGYYLHCFDLDFEDEEVKTQFPDRYKEIKRDMRAALTEMFPLWRAYPQVRSGSHGSGFHVYTTSDEPFPTVKLAESDMRVLLFDDEGQPILDKHGDQKTKPAWTITLMGTGTQTVLPPSIHPDTGLAYEWEIKFDTEDTGSCFLSSVIIGGWSAVKNRIVADAKAEWVSGGLKDTAEIIKTLLVYPQYEKIKKWMESEGDGDRSKHCYNVIMHLLERGLSDDEILALAAAEDSHFADKFVEEGKKRIVNEITRLRGKWAANSSKRLSRLEALPEDEGEHEGEAPLRYDELMAKLGKEGMTYDEGVALSAKANLDPARDRVISDALKKLSDKEKLGLDLPGIRQHLKTAKKAKEKAQKTREKARAEAEKAKEAEE